MLPSISSLEYMLGNSGGNLYDTNFLKFLNNSLTSNNFNFGKYLLDGINGVGDFMDKYSQPIGMAAGIWSGYNSQKMAKKQYELQKDAYNYNKMLSEEERKRRVDADKNFNLGMGHG